jgi:nucleotide-binding universal stress UspA family protein
MSANPYRILVGLDFSESSAGALDHALELAAARAPAEIHVACIVDQKGSVESPDSGDLRMNVEEVARSLRQILAAKLAGGTLPAEDALRVFAHVRVGSPVPRLVELAAETDADLVVIGTHGRRGFERMWVGSVAERLVRLATCPVVAARPKDHRRANLRELQPEPPCPACTERRFTTKGREWWCERHDSPPELPHAIQHSSLFERGRDPVHTVW